MSDGWNEYRRRISVWTQIGDNERIAMAQLVDAGFDCQEHDPERSLKIFTQGRDEARRLDEPWWVLFYESWRLTALTSYIMDFTRALPLAAELMARIQSPEGLAYSDRITVLNEILNTYVNIDAFGYSNEIERALAYLDAESPNGATGDRFVLYFRWRTYLCSIERWDEAYDLAMRSLALADQPPNRPIWHGSWTLYQLCRICDALGRRDELGDHADHMASLADRHPQLHRIRADARLWRAVADRLVGDERAASAAFHRGMAMLDGIDRRDSVCADPIARYYELAGDPRAAVGVRDRELAEVERKGQVHRVCEVHVERCRLLALLGELTPNDLDSARRSVANLRQPGRFLDRLNRLGAGPQS